MIVLQLILFCALFALMVNTFARKHGFIEVLPVCCELDHLLTEASHGKLIREYTLATGGSMCDYWIVPDQLKNPQQEA